MNNRIEQFSHPHNGTAHGSVSDPGLAESEIQSSLQTQASKTMQWIKEHPAATTGAALLLGVIVGWIIKRR